MTVRSDKLLHMAEQITANMAYTDDQSVVAAKVADHLNRFWDPRMKAALRELHSEGSEQMSPALEEAIGLIHD